MVEVDKTCGKAKDKTIEACQHTFRVRCGPASVVQPARYHFYIIENVLKPGCGVQRISILMLTLMLKYFHVWGKLAHNRFQQSSLSVVLPLFRRGRHYLSTHLSGASRTTGTT